MAYPAESIVNISAEHYFSLIYNCLLYTSLTNSLVPCNGRLPTLVTLITIFFVAQISNPAAGSFLSAILLTLTILLGVAATLGASWILSHTLLKGIPSSFTLELPPYRRPEIRKVIVRSIFDRTLFVLGRAVAVAAPAGLIIWILANIAYTGPGAGWFASAAQTDAPSLLTLFTGFLEDVYKRQDLHERPLPLKYMPKQAKTEHFHVVCPLDSSY